MVCLASLPTIHRTPGKAAAAAGHADTWRGGRAHSQCRPLSASSIIVALLMALMSLGAPRAARSGEMIVTVEPLEPAASVWILSAPHIGKKTCEVPAATHVRFIARASHGPHRYPEVEVTEGGCAGQHGYVPWSYLEPEPNRAH